MAFLWDVLLGAWCVTIQVSGPQEESPSVDVSILLTSHWKYQTLLFSIVVVVNTSFFNCGPALVSLAMAIHIRRTLYLH